MSRLDGAALADRRDGGLLWPALVAALAAIVVVYWSTFVSLVSVWRQSDTFAHCFLIAPISLYLIWRQRAVLARAPKQASALGLTAIVVLSAGWLVATAANVQFGRQLTAVLMLPAVVLALLGVDATKRIAFPLAFLLFAVPFGEVLIPSLMDVTATFTVAALKVTGIPVLREGTYFSIPSGDFEIAKACSGIRYLIASVALGLLYSYLSYRSWRKRTLFVAVSIVAPVIANGLRAYMIVMIAHLSGMRLAVGVDHLIYGWLFFGGLVALLFWVGSYFQDPPEAVTSARPPTEGAATPAVGLIVAIAAAVVALAALGPFLSYSVQARAASRNVSATVPKLAGLWQGPEPPPEIWRRPANVTEGRELRAAYAGSAGRVELAVVAYAAQSQDSKMVGAVNAMIDPHRWQTLENHAAAERLPGGFAPRELVLRSGGAQQVLWYWYLVGGAHTAEDWRAKVAEAWSVLAHGEDESTLVLLSTEGEDLENARALLRGFAEQAIPSIDVCVRAPAPDCVDVQ